jgi:hypothetical protein
LSRTFTEYHRQHLWKFFRTQNNLIFSVIVKHLIPLQFLIFIYSLTHSLTHSFEEIFVLFTKKMREQKWMSKREVYLNVDSSLKLIAQLSTCGYQKQTNFSRTWTEQNEKKKRFNKHLRCAIQTIVWIN